MRYLLIALIVLCSFSQSANAKLSPSTVSFWERVAQCETGSRWDWGSQHRHLEGHKFEGGVGFAASTWRAWAGKMKVGKTGKTVLDYFPHAYNAPKRVQIWVAQYGLMRGGYWGCLH